jgi:hypothetical protein
VARGLDRRRYEHLSSGDGQQGIQGLSLFDSFPSEQQERQLTGWVTPGAIVYLHCPWILKPYKDKYLVVGSIQPECLLFMVSTDARRVAVQTQVQLCVSNYGGVLTQNCFINCNTVIDQITYNGVRQQLKNDGGRYKCRLTAGDQREVVAAVKFAQDISPIHQDMIYAALDEAA